MNEAENFDKSQDNGVLPCVSRNFTGLFMHYDNGDMKKEFQKQSNMRGSVLRKLNDIIENM